MCNAKKTNGQIMFAFTRSELACSLRDSKPLKYRMLKSMLEYILNACAVPVERFGEIELQCIDILKSNGFVSEIKRPFLPQFFGDLFGTASKGDLVQHIVPVRE